MRSGAALALVLSGCLHPTVQECSGGGQTWVCPSDQSCAQAPTYCSTPNEVGACQGKLDDDACSSALVADGICEAGVCQACSFDIAACRYVGWVPMTSGTTSDITAIASIRPGEAYAGTATGEVRHYLTSGWEPVDLGMPDVNQVVAMQAHGTRVYALFGDTQTVAQRVAYLENGTWTALPSLGSAALYTAMWIAPNGDVVLVGATGAVAHFAGATWSETTAAAASTAVLRGVWGTGPSDIYAVGSKHTIIHYDGAAWSLVGSPGGAFDAYNTVWGTGGDVFVAGAIPGTATGTGIVHASGGQPFTAMPAAPLTMGAVAAWGSSATDVWLVGNGGTGNTAAAVISHWDGVAWTQIQAPPMSSLLAVTGSGPGEIFAGGVVGTVLRYTGAAWAVDPVAPTDELNDLWASASNEVFAVGTHGGFHLKADRTWGSSSGLYTAVTGRSATDVVAVGNAQSSVWNGSAFPTASAAPIGAANAIAATATGYVAVSDSVSSSPTGMTWMNHPVTPNMLSAVRRMWISPSGTVWLATAGGVDRIDASYALTVELTGVFAGIWGFADDDIYAVGDDVRHYDGTQWTSMLVPTQAKLDGVWGRGTDDVFAVGVNHTVLHYHGGLWKQLPTPFTSDLGAISGAGASVFMTSLDGKVYQLVETVP